MTKTEQRKAEIEVRKAAKRAKWAAIWNREIKFAPPCSVEEFFAPLPSSAQALRAKINRDRRRR